MANVFLIVTCMLAGVLLRRAGKLPDTTPKVLNTFVIYLSFPAVVLLQVPALIATTPLSRDILVPVSMGWLMFIAAVIVFRLLGAFLKWRAATTGAVILGAGLANTSFVGFPLLEALLGIEALKIGVVVDQTGSFLTVSTLGLAVASYYSGRGLSAWTMLKRVILFPPFVVLIAAVCIEMSGWTEVILGNSLMQVALSKLSGTLVPLALVSVGYQLRVSYGQLKLNWVPLALGLSFKLFLAPFCFSLLYIAAMGARGEAAHITILQSAMAPMITGAIIAAEFDLDTEVANLFVGIGIPLSLLTVPAWHYVLLLFIS